MTEWRLVCDGACEPRNPGGVMAVGYVLYGSGVAKLSGGLLVGGLKRTNSVAELRAIRIGLEKAAEYFQDAGRAAPVIVVCSDSQLAIGLLTGGMKTDLFHLATEVDAVRRVQAFFPRVIYRWVSRAQTEVADDLAMQALSELGIVRREYGRAKDKAEAQAEELGRNS